MSLTEIQRFIFYNFVRNHIKKRKPIGSKILAKKLKKFSPPTLRFYFQKLVEQGYLENVEDFSGRQPTERGWHYYLENYELKPEIKLPEKTTPLDEFLKKVAFLTKNVVFYRESFASRYIFRGLKNSLAQLEERDLLLDFGEMIENLEKTLTKINKDFEVLIGKEIEGSRTKKLSLIIKKSENFEIGFLGPKINYYHTLFSVFQNLNNGRK